MKSLIISCPKEDRKIIAAERYQSMIQQLKFSDIDAQSVVVHSKRQLLDSIRTFSPDIIFSAQDLLISDSDEKLRVHSFLDKMLIPYIGSTSEALALVISKSGLKSKWEADHISTPDFCVLHKKDWPEIINSKPVQSFDFPMILKPDSEGNSRGLDESSVVFSLESLKMKLQSLFEIYDSILVEQYLGGFPGMREFTVAMIGNGNQCLYMPAEITLKYKKKVRIITTQDKDNPLTIAMPVEDVDLRSRLVEFSKKAFLSSGVRDYSRCDIIMANNRLYAIEVNGQPMVPDKWFEMCAKGSGLETDQYISAIFLAGIVRNLRSGVGGLSIPSPMKELLPPEIYDYLTDEN